MRLLTAAFVGAMAVSLAASQLHAQPSLTLSAGPSLPVAATAEVYELGYGATVGLGIKPALAAIGVRLEVLYNELQRKASSANVARTVAAMFNATFSSPTSNTARGYLIGGAGIYNTKITNFAESWNTDFGINGGVGFVFPSRSISAYVEGRFHLINTEGDAMKMVPFLIGIRF